MSNERASSPGRNAVSRTAVFRMLVKDFMREKSEVLSVNPAATCLDTIAAFAGHDASCAIVVDDAQKPIGIVTEYDAARKIAYRVSPETPIQAVMTAPVITIREDGYLYQGIARMRRHKLRHMPVVNAEGRLSGILHIDDALVVAVHRLIAQIDLIAHEDSIEGLKQIKAAQVDLADELFSEDVSAVEIQQLLTNINNDIYRRIAENARRQMISEGWGEPPVSSTLIVMGSGGRGENYIFPDQDNGLVLSDYADSEHNFIDQYFIEFAERVCRDLNAVGISYCNGYCMAVSPLWRKTISQWKHQIRLWEKSTNAISVRLSDIFFDFRPAWGEQELAVELRAAVTQMARNNPFFLRKVFEEKAGHNVALGFFGRFHTETSEDEFKGHINLKYAGLIPLVEVVRLLSLREGVEATSTLARIASLEDAGVLSADEAEGIDSAYRLITDLLLRTQVKDFKSGKRVGYFINPRALSKHGTASLSAALRRIEKTRERIRMEFTADVF